VEALRQEEAGHDSVVGLNLAAMMEEDAKAAEKLSMEQVKERAHLHAECTADEVEQEAAWCQEAIGNIPNAMTMKIMICAKSKMWWNANIRERRMMVGRENRRRQNSDEAARAEAELHKSIWQSKRTMWSEYIHNVKGAEVWRAAQSTNPRAGTTVEAQTDREGKQANTSPQNKVMLSCKSFHPNGDGLYYELPPTGSAHTRVTEQAVERAVLCQLVEKAPGPDKLSFGAIRLLWQWDKQRFARRAKAPICTGSHPVQWKRASGVVIHKPGKEDSTRLKAYHYISLVSCIGKVVEKVVAELLSNAGEKRGVLSEEQFGSKRGQSAIDAVAIMVARAHAAWRNGHITGVLLTDIKAAFPSVAKGRLVNLMKVMEMDGDLIRWTESSLSGRTVEMIIDGNAIKRHTVEAGVPHGSPVSPILFAIYTS